jgi:hypothetical protein
VVSDDDFINPRHPECGYVPSLAVEKFSDIVNRVPYDAGDEMNTVMSDESIDSIYFHRLLSPAMPYVSSDADAGTQQRVTDNFNAMKASALKLWNSVTLESSSGVMLEYKPSVATPVTWYDIAKDGIWTSQSFHISGSSAPTQDSAGSKLWRLQPSDAALAEALTAPEQPVGKMASNLRDRIHVNAAAIANGGPTRPVETSTIAIHFDYCPVTIRRPWLENAFLDSTSWYVPGVPTGEVTAIDSSGNLALMPIGFVAIRSLIIEAEWTAQDIANAAAATNFGPFKVTPKIVDGKLIHSGIQIIAWLLRGMPALPPRDPSGMGNVPAELLHRSVLLPENSDLNLDPGPWTRLKARHLLRY